MGDLLFFCLLPWQDAAGMFSQDVGPLTLAFPAFGTIRNKSLFFINYSA
jgi:hypothetical protein